MRHVRHRSPSAHRRVCPTFLGPTSRSDGRCAGGPRRRVGRRCVPASLARRGRCGSESAAITGSDKLPEMPSRDGESGTVLLPGGSAAALVEWWEWEAVLSSGDGGVILDSSCSQAGPRQPLGWAPGDARPRNACMFPEMPHHIFDSLDGCF